MMVMVMMVMVFLRGNGGQAKALLPWEVQMKQGHDFVQEKILKAHCKHILSFFHFDVPSLTVLLCSRSLACLPNMYRHSTVCTNLRASNSLVSLFPDRSL